MENETVFEVKGTRCTLVVSEDHEDDCTKMWHELVEVGTGKCIATLGWSPYSCPSDAEVQQLIDLGLPDGLRWHHSHPLARFNFDSTSLILFLSGEELDKSHGKLELVFRVWPVAA